MTPGPKSAIPVAAGVNSVQLTNAAGTLNRVIITVAGSAAASFYDYIQGAGSLPLPLFTIPSNATQGAIYELECPINNGLWYVGPANAPQSTVTCG